MVDVITDKERGTTNRSTGNGLIEKHEVENPLKSETTSPTSNTTLNGKNKITDVKKDYPKTDGYFNIHVQGMVPVTAQPTSKTCWAAVITMMLSWRDQRSGYTIDQAMNLAGPYYGKRYNNNEGLPAEEKSDLLNNLKMSAEPPVNYSVGRLKYLLQRYGPLWVTTNEAPSGQFSVHARIIEGMMGFKKPDMTILYVVDPAGGVRTLENFIEFMRKFEEFARAPSSWHTLDEQQPIQPVQVIHFKKIIGKLEELPMGMTP